MSYAIDLLLDRSPEIALAVAVILLVVVFLQWWTSRTNQQTIERAIDAFKEIFGKK